MDNVYISIYGQIENLVKLSFVKLDNDYTILEYGQTDLFSARTTDAVNYIMSKYDPKKYYEVSNYKDHFGTTALFWVSYEATKILVEKYSADIHIKSVYGETPLMYSVFNNCIDKISYLLSIGADINEQNACGKTALFKARTYETIKLLIDNGADIMHTDINGETAFTCLTYTDLFKYMISLAKIDFNFKYRGTTYINYLKLSNNPDDIIKYSIIINGSL